MKIKIKIENENEIKTIIQNIMVFIKKDDQITLKKLAF